MASGELSTEAIAAGELSSYPVGNLAGLTRRRNSSPYPHPPTEFCRELMSKGWRRCYAERIDVVRIALAHADDLTGVQTWAARAADALAHEPVLAGVLHRLPGLEDVQPRAFRLFLAAPHDRRAGLATLFLAAAKAGAMDRLLEQNAVGSRDDAELDEVAG